MDDGGWRPSLVHCRNNWRDSRLLCTVSDLKVSFNWRDNKPGSELRRYVFSRVFFLISDQIIRMQDNKVRALAPFYCSKHLPMPKSVYLSLIANDILCINKLRTRATTAVVLLGKWSRYTLISWSFWPVFTWQKYPRKSFWKFLATVFSMELPKHRLTPIGCFIPLKVSTMQRCQLPKSAFW